MDMKWEKILNGIILIFFIVTIVGVCTFAHVCNGMKGMTPPCHSTKIGAIGVGSIGALIALLSFWSKKRVIRIAESIVLLMNSIIIILLPGVVTQICKMKTMHCNIYTRPFLIIIGTVLTVFALGSLFIEVRRKEEKRE